MMRAKIGLARFAAPLVLALVLGGCGVLHRTSRSAHAALEVPHAQAPARGDATPAESPRADDALAAARARAALEPHEPYWPFREAELVLERGGNAAASDAGNALEAALERDPGYVPATALLSRLDFAAGRHERAIARLEPYRMPQAGVSDAERRLLLEGLALHYDAVGRFDLAEAMVQEIGPPPGDSPASTRVYLVLRGAEPDRAAEPAVQALKRGPETAVNRNNYGITRLRAGDVEQAREAFERAIEIDPALPGPYYNLALLERHYRFDEPKAQRWLDRYRRLSNDDPDGMLATPAATEAATATRDTTRGRD
jgi:tetratricopeptide (TPR) repeat protein